MILCADSSGLWIQFCLADDSGQELAAIRTELKSELSRDMSRLYDMLLVRHGSDFTPRIETIYAGMGPGAFIGTRVALSFVNGLAAGRGIPLRGFDSLAALRLSVDDAQAVAVRDARRGQYYVNDAAGSRLLDSAGLEELVSRAAHLVSDVIPATLLADRSLVKLADQLALCPGRLSWLEFPTVVAMLAAATPETPEYVEPLYLRGYL